MSKLVFDFNELNTNDFVDGGSGVTGLFYDASGALESTAGGIRVKAVSITDGMLAGSISSSKLTDEAQIAFLNQTETVAAAWDFTTLPTLDVDATTANQAVRLSQLQGLLAGLVWLSPSATAMEYVGNAAAATIEVLTPAAGTTYVVSTANGAADLVGSALGDVVEYDGAAWQVIEAGVGGFVADGVRLVVADDVVTLLAPLTEGIDESKYVDFDGTSLTPLTKTAPVEGNVFTIGDSDSVLLGDAFQWNAGNNTWISFNAGATDHGALTGLSDDDHSIYALLAGRSGGQTLIGGTAASENLVLQSTSNATRGVVQINDDAQVVGNLQIDGQAYTPITTLADAATILTDCDLGNSFDVTLTATRILGNPTNLQEGATYIWAIDQGAGGFSLTYGGLFNFKGGGVPSLSSSAGAVDLITALYRDGVLEATIVTQDDLGVATHAATHIQGGADEIDGDQIDIDIALPNITPDTGQAEGDDANQLGPILKGISDALGAATPAIPDPYYHAVTAGEVTAGFFTLTTVPLNAAKVLVTPVNGISQINKQIVGATGITPDYDIGVDGAGTVSINNTGVATGLSLDINTAGLVLLVTYQG